MLRCFSTPDLVAALPFVIDLLENEVVCGNRLADVAWVGMSPDDDAERAADFRGVYPAG